MPLPYLLALFVGLPVIELSLLIRLHALLGLLPALGLILLTGVVGASLVRHQSLDLLLRIQRELSNGVIPAPQIIDGVMLLLAGALLITPGLITDIFGFLLLIPHLRGYVRAWLKRKMEEKVRSGFIQVNINR